MKPRVIFVNVPSPFLVSDRGAPPLGILWLAAEVRQAGYDVQVWDQTGDRHLAKQFGCEADVFIGRGNFSLPAWIEHSPDDTVFGLTCTSAQYHAARNLLTALKWTNPHWTVIIGGSHASALPHDAINDGFDAVFAGEADMAMVDWLNGGAGFKGIIHCKAPRDLDVLPMPARELVDVSSYCANLTTREGVWATTVHLSRGCPFDCAYCDRQLGDAARLLRVRAIHHVWHEIVNLDATYGLRHFVATDDVFGIKRDWLSQFCQVFRGNRFHFRVNMRANTIHTDLLPAMKHAGIDVISFGFESGSEQVLSAISKNSVELNTKAVQACHDAGISVKAYLIFGFAEDDQSSVDATIRWIEQAHPDSVQVSWLVPLPGTPLYTQAITQGWQPAYHELYHLGRDKRGSMNRLPWHQDETAEQYEDLCEWLEGFYAQPQPMIECPNALSTSN